MKNLDWTEKKTPRSVKQLKLWPENPRLNPDDDYLYLSDYAEDFMSEQGGEQEKFKDLVRSITQVGFISLDPIVVWKEEENDKYFVAEGNRRVLALKLLLEPQKAPRWIRSFFVKESKKVDSSSIEKIMVHVAPSLEHAEWYISQRNNASSLQRSWTRLQQNRWVEHLYNKYNGNFEEVREKTNLSEAQLNEIIRRIKILNLIKLKEVKENLSSEVFEEASSHRFPLTIIERFFGNRKVKDAWGVDFEGPEIKIKADKSSFYNAFSDLVRKIVNRERDEKPINTRTITSEIDSILKELPEVNLNGGEEFTTEETLIDKNQVDELGKENNDLSRDEKEDVHPPSPQKMDPNRNKMILQIYDLHTDNYRLKTQFNELKKITYRKYKSSISSALRVFLDLAVYNFIETEQLENEVRNKFNKPLKAITLKQRLEYLKQHKLKSGTTAHKHVSKMLNTDEHFSLDVLNGYVHSNNTHYISKEFLNGFWDFLFPLFEEILEIKEK